MAEDNGDLKFLPPWRNLYVLSQFYHEKTDSRFQRHCGVVTTLAHLGRDPARGSDGVRKRVARTDRCQLLDRMR
jgi:hypothetical protein